MATIDYGALLRVNGKFINYNKDLFSEIIYPEGDIPEYTQYVYSGKLQKRPVKGNYFIYAGDTTFMLAFYKRMFDVISDGSALSLGLFAVYRHLKRNKDVIYKEDLENLKLQKKDA